jgi:hypothetical protein
LSFGLLGVAKRLVPEVAVTTLKRFGR